MNHFKGKTAVLTGGASGFGLALGKQLAAQGAKIALVDIEVQALDAAKAEIESFQAVVETNRVDVGQAEAMDAMAAEIKARFGPVHLLFNNAGVASNGRLWENSAKDWTWLMNVNLFGVANGIRSFVPDMIAHGEAGVVINTASLAGLISAQGMGLYAASKHAVVTMTECLKADLEAEGSLIKTAVLCPGFVPTGISRSERNRPKDERTKTLTAAQKASAAMVDDAMTRSPISADDVASATLKAVAAGETYILTHPLTKDWVKARLEAIMATQLYV